MSAFYVFSFGFVPSLFLSLFFYYTAGFSRESSSGRNASRERFPFLFVDRDNARGSSEIETRFREKRRSFSLSRFSFFARKSPLSSRAEIDPISLFPSSSFWTFFLLRLLLFRIIAKTAIKKIDFLTLTLFSSSRKQRTDENPRFEETGGNEIRGETVRTAHFVSRTVGRGRYELIVGAGGE